MGTEPIDDRLARTVEQDDAAERILVVVVGEHAFDIALDTHDEPAELHVVADVDAGQEAVAVAAVERAREGNESARRDPHERFRDEVVSIVGPAVPDLGTHIEARPGEDRNRGEHRRRGHRGGTHGKVGSHRTGREAEKRDGREKNFFHLCRSVRGEDPATLIAQLGPKVCYFPATTPS